MTRPVALLAWELGAGFGHARRLLAVGRRLVAEGFACTLAGRELWACADEFHAAGIRLLQAPHHQSQVPPGGVFRARGYADMMAVCGYQREAALWPTVLGWDGMIDAVRPDVIVADYSPMLALAVYGRVPMVAIGDGFVLPPTHVERFPMLRAGTDMGGEPEMLAIAAAVQARRGLPAPASLPGLIGGQAQVVCTYPESDIFAASRLAPALGPIEAQPKPLAPAPERSVFVYLAADYPHTAKLLQVICDLRLPAAAFVRDAPGPLKTALRGAGLRVHDHPPPLPEALAAASLVVHHGGIGTIETCLAAGRPQVLLPRHFEQTLNAAALTSLGVARVIPGGFTLADGRLTLGEAVASRDLRDRAETVATAVAALSEGSCSAVVAACRTLAA